MSTGRSDEGYPPFEMADPRILAIMGSGETAPTMAKVHRALFDRLGAEPNPAVIIDTPYGFQENANDLSARTVQFFRERLGRDVAVATYRNRDVDAVTSASAVALVRGSRYLMTGPGSPSYALRQWAGGPIPSAIVDRLRSGGVVTMASAAALTLGVSTIPVYEIYKVGEAAHWLPGLDILGELTGLRAAVVPHYDNAEGGNHDTRFCYMGERRLLELEWQLADGAFVLGVDGHTALILDLERGRASVAGRGGVTVRARGRSTVLPSGTELDLQELGDIARRLADGAGVDIGWEPANTVHRREPKPPSADDEPPSIRLAAAEFEGAFVDALARDDRRASVAALLDLDLAIERWTRSGEDNLDLDNAQSLLHALITRLADPESTAVPADDEKLARLVDDLIRVRDGARDSGHWSSADGIRAALARAGVQVRDQAAGQDG